MEQLEVAANRDAFGEISAIVELEHRNSAERIFLEKLRLTVNALEDIDFFERNGDGLFGQEYAHTTRIGCEFVVVNFHWIASAKAILSRVMRAPAVSWNITCIAHKGHAERWSLSGELMMSGKSWER
jgi:hypothetical protein